MTELSILAQNRKKFKEYTLYFDDLEAKETEVLTRKIKDLGAKIGDCQVSFNRKVLWSSSDTYCNNSSCI